MIITVEKLQQTALYEEICDCITRQNDDIVSLQIMAAQSLAASYLFKYNLKEVFGDDTANPPVPPSVACPALEHIIVTIACYYLVRMSSPNIDTELYADAYKQAVKLLEDIRDGLNNLTELHYAADDPTTEDDESIANGVSWSSNPKRNNFF